MVVITLNKLFDGNKTKICSFLHIGRNRVTEILAESEYEQNAKKASDMDGYINEDNEKKHKMEILEKENRAMLAELSDAKSEHERLVKNSIKAWHQRQQQNSVPPQFALAQEVLRRMIKQKRLPTSFLKYVH